MALTSAGMSVLPIGIVAKAFGAGAQSVRALSNAAVAKIGSTQSKAIVLYSGQLTPASWPSNAGFLGSVRETELKVGTLIDRYGPRAIAGKFGKQAILAVLTVGQAGNLHTANQFASGAIPFSIAFGAASFVAKKMGLNILETAFDSVSAKAFELVVNNWNVPTKVLWANSSVSKSTLALPF